MQLYLYGEQQRAFGISNICSNIQTYIVRKIVINFCWADKTG